MTHTKIARELGFLRSPPSLTVSDSLLTPLTCTSSHSDPIFRKTHFFFLIFGHQTLQLFCASDIGLSLVRVIAASPKGLIKARIQSGKQFVYSWLMRSCVLWLAFWSLGVRACLPRAPTPPSVIQGEVLYPHVSRLDSRSWGAMEGRLWDVVECPGAWVMLSSFQQVCKKYLPPGRLRAGP